MTGTARQAASTFGNVVAMMRTMTESGDARKIFDVATKCVIQMAPTGVTVGLHLHGPDAYGEGHSPEGDLDAAARTAYARAQRRQADRDGPPPAFGT